MPRRAGELPGRRTMGLIGRRLGAPPPLRRLGMGLGLRRRLGRALGTGLTLWRGCSGLGVRRRGTGLGLGGRLVAGLRLCRLFGAGLRGRRRLMAGLGLRRCGGGLGSLSRCL